MAKPSSPRRELDSPWNPLRLDRHLDHTFSPLAKELVGLSDLVQRKRYLFSV